MNIIITKVPPYFVLVLTVCIDIVTHRIVPSKDLKQIQVSFRNNKVFNIYHFYFLLEVFTSFYLRFYLF